MCYLGNILSWIAVVFWYFQGGATVAVALFAVIIARQQSKTNAEKLKLDLFDRRYRVYAEVRKILGVVYPRGTVELSDISTFKAGTVEAAFLFGPEIEEYIRDISAHAQRLEISNSEMREALPGRDLVLIEETRAEVNWLKEQFEVSREKFRKYLDFTKL